MICTVLVSKSPRHPPHPGPVGRRAGQPGAGGLRQEAQRQLISEHNKNLFCHNIRKVLYTYKDKEDICQSCASFLYSMDRAK